MASVGDSLMCNGSGFQRVGAATVKARSPQERFSVVCVCEPQEVSVSGPEIAGGIIAFNKIAEILEPGY